MSKALIVYYSGSGRTKRVAELLEKGLSDYNSVVFPIIYHGKVRQMSMNQQKIKNGDTTGFELRPEILDLTPYDLVCIGVPTYGNFPCPAFDAYLNQCKGIQGKDVIVFNSCRFSFTNTIKQMKSAVEAKGGNVVGELGVKGLFSLKTDGIQEFADKLSKK
jgi:flavodoxin